ncbi:hypothetical protein BAE44_0002456 [Dichanthelium oligosanthes]|uniref:F-box domain-containing protein n=1 Tax=Dichanthelium oligosanthes TaxID=888268 RepID=A0A1E5WGQ1_9POAL|nr:hypothetical protein BAE44_0002456 [Dichanthelium oligosanthes]
MTATAAQPEAAATSRDLNDDVVTEILLRLPSAAVLPWRAVFKAWRRIIASPVFLAVHSRRFPLELIVQRHGVNDEVAALDTVPPLTLDETRRRCLHVPRQRGGYSLIASCDGLLMFERGPGMDVVNAGVEEVRNVILLGDCWSHSIHLYDLTEKRVLKQI